MPDNVLIATANDINGAHQKVVNEYLDAGGLPVSVSIANPLPVLASISTAGLATSTAQTAGNNNLASIDGKTPALGQALVTASSPVALPASQITILTPPAQITGFATEATIASLNSKTPAGLTVVANRLQVELPAGSGGLTNVEIRATPLPVSNASLPLPAGASTSALQGSTNASLSAIDAKIPTLGQALATASTPVVLTVSQITTLTPPAQITGFALASNQQTNAITDAQIRATPLPISGTVNTGIIQPLTDTQLRATALPISGTVVTGGLTDTQIRATPLPVTMSNTLALTDTQIRATPLPVLTPAEGIVSIGNSTVVNLAANGLFTGVSEDISIYSNVKINVFSSHGSAINGLSYQQSHDGTFYPPSTDVYTIPANTQKSFSVAANMKTFKLSYVNGATATTTIVIQVIYSKSDKQASSVRPQDGRANDNDFIEELSYLMGYNSIADSWNRIGITNATTGGNENLIDRIKVNAALRMIDNAQPSGSKLVNVTGTQALGLDVNVKNTTLPVTGAFFQATQPISGTIVSTQSVASNLNMTEASASTILARTPALGQVTATASTPVTQNIETASGTITTQNLVPAGSATAGSAVEIILAGSATLAIQTTGTYTGALSLQVTSDGANWVTVGGTPLININTGGYLVSITSALQSVFQTEVTGFLRARITALGAVTGTATITLRATANTSMVSLDAGLPAGTAVIGGVTQSGVWTAQIGNTPNTTAILANPLTPAVSVTGDTGAKTVTGNGATQTNTTAKGAHIIINMGAVTGTTPTFIAKLQGSADGGATWYDLPSATTASLVATGVFGIMIYPALSAVAGTTVTGTTAQVSSSLPRSWRLFWTIGGTTPSFSITNIQVSYLI